MHFTFIALTPVIDVDFLSYQYKFFRMQMACWWKSSAEGTWRGKDSPCRPSTANPWALQPFWGTLFRACKTWARPFVQEPCRRSKTSAMCSSLTLFWLGRQTGREHIPAFATCTAHAGWQALELPFILVPPYKHTSVFSNRLHQTCLLQSNTMDKNWRQKSSLMYCSFRVKHSIANPQAATQELNVILYLKIKLQLI